MGAPIEFGSYPQNTVVNRTCRTQTLSCSTVDQLHNVVEIRCTSTVVHRMHDGAR